MSLRPYQQDCHDKAIAHLRRSYEPILIEAFTASGKSHIVASIAKTLVEITGGKKVLVLQPSIELLEQNAEKYDATGEKYSIFSASAGRKSVKHPVVFATALSVNNMLDKFCERFCCVILDEAHLSVTPTIKNIIAVMREKNPNLRVLGLTSSPYKLGYGYIYEIDIDGKQVPADKAFKPFFKKLIARVTGRELLEQEYITPIQIGAIHCDNYDTSGLQIGNNGKYTSESVDAAFVGHGRKTSLIVADVVKNAVNRTSVMLFASTVQHAHEIMASLPPDLSGMITGDTKLKNERKRIIKEFKEHKLKYIVSVGTLTTGFDCPSVDLIAILRATESAALCHQILGRGVRLCEGKTECLVLDYAGNVLKFWPNGDLFKVDIEASAKDKKSPTITCLCPSCGNENIFAGTLNEEGYQIDENGYFLDLDGKRIPTKYGYLPGHYGRRCTAYPYIQHGKYVQCEYRWTFKPCPNEECGAENDIAARYCIECKTEIVDPGEKLTDEYRPAVYDPYLKTKSAFIDWKLETSLSKSGNMMIKAIIITVDRVINVYMIVDGWDYKKFAKETNDGKNKPTAISYKKNNDGFWKIMKYHF